ncbi:MAG: 2-oxoglutarate dehydrogenase E1 component [Legionellales bacterium]|nr:2-oxoglutarate dehydrogenase E1 component [Legionellales bacterium]
MAALWDSSPFAGGNAAYLEDLFETYLTNPDSLPGHWQEFFRNLPGQGIDKSHASIREAFAQLVKSPVTVSGASSDVEHERMQMRVRDLVHAYRLDGHVKAKIDPLKTITPPEVKELSLQFHGLSDADKSTTFKVGDFAGPAELTLAEIEKALNDTYCGSIGFETMHIVSTEERQWLQNQIEAGRGRQQYSAEKKKRILERLTAAEGLEKYLGAKYPGAKRFSLEGGDALAVMMDTVIHRCGDLGAKDMVIGMAHRGRLNVLVNSLGKKPSDLFSEFEGKYAPDLESGDVKYHQGFSSDFKTKHGTMHASLAFNPSHLEIVTPVVIGSVRARQEARQDSTRNQVIPVAIHGDAAFAGQGVVMEVLNMSQTRGYRVGGTLHIVINNQVGFTTSNPDDARSTLYCSDVAKMIQAPIFHVNGDDPEAVLWATELAVDYRMKFNKDVVIDLTCYRRHGHNEADEPAMTQPQMYQFIRKHPTVRKLYADQLVRENVITEDDANAFVKRNREQLDKGENLALELLQKSGEVETAFNWRPHLKQDWRWDGSTGVNAAELRQAGERLTTIPDNIQLHSRVQKLIGDRQKMAKGEQLMDWGFAENMAYATLLREGTNVRLSGQDCGRGTFSHRHAAMYDQKTAEPYFTLQNLADNQGTFTVIDSLLSEEAVLAFEYGFSSTDPNTLTIWEAQFGDFANGAQVVIDQFISSGEQKWGRLSGLVMLLPHGYEGMGPEHSSARLERFLQLCAQHNIQVCVPSTPAQVFHMLRRQIQRPMRRPLVVMSPKSLLRHKEAVSELSELETGEFKTVIDDNELAGSKSVERVVMCSGKVYYDLLQTRRDLQKDNVALVRVEQLYPFPKPELKDILASYPKAKEVVWCQEEPMNQGAWYSSQHHMRACLAAGQELRYAGRLASASPAAGYASLHQQQQNELLYDAIK